MSHGISAEKGLPPAGVEFSAGDFSSIVRICRPRSASPGGVSPRSLGPPAGQG